MAASTGERQQSGRFPGVFCITTFSLLLTGLAACASQNPGANAIAMEATAPPVEPGPGVRVTTRDTYLGPAAAQESDYGSFSRRVKGTAGIIGNNNKT